MCLANKVPYLHSKESVVTVKGMCRVAEAPCRKANSGWEQSSQKEGELFEPVGFFGQEALYFATFRHK